MKCGIIYPAFQYFPIMDKYYPNTQCHMITRFIYKKGRFITMPANTKKLTAAAAAAVLAAAVFSAIPTVCADTQSEPKVSMELLAGGSAIGMDVYFTLPGGDTLSDCTVTFDDKTPSVTAAEDGWKFSVSEYAMNMTKPHELVIKAKDSSYNTSVPISVRDYLANFTDDADYGPLAKSMLMYGGAAQTYFKVNTDSLASAGITGADYSSVNIASDAFDKTALASALASDSAPVTYYGMNLSLKSETVFTLFFKVADGSTQSEALSYLGNFSFGEEAASAKANGQKFAEISLTVPAAKLTDSYTLKKGSISAEFSPAQYLAAAASDSDTALANVCKALYAYADAAKNFTPGGHDTPAALSDSFVTRTGRATTYNYSVGNAHLDDYVADHNAYVAALTDDDYAAYAGGMIEVTYNGKSICAIVADSMPLADNPTRKKGDVDLDPNAFKALTGQTTGDFDITWRIVPNSYAEGTKIQYHYEAGQIYYMKIQPRNTIYPVAKFEVKIGSGSYTALTKTQDNCYVIKPNGQSVLSFRITDMFGQVIEEKDYDTKMTATEVSNIVQNGTVQFEK